MSVITTEPHLLSAARWRGLRVGILGGSFNPPHEGHLHIAKLAMERFKLDAVWWLVSPGNPLKGDPKGDIDRRMDLVRAFIKDQPQMVASDLEAQMQTRYTYDTVQGLMRHFPDTKFLWIAGMDIAETFDQWQNWEELPQMIPFVFYDRPPGDANLRGKKIRNNNRIRQNPDVTDLEPGVHWVLDGPALAISSSALRQKGQ